MNIVDKVLKLANEEIGYLEKESNKDLYDKTKNAGDKNYTKYGKDLDDIKYYNGAKNGYAWCCVFFNWLLVKTLGEKEALTIVGQPSINNYGAGCTEAMNYYKSNGKFYNSPKIGDQIFFTNDNGKTSYHTGIVSSFSFDKVVTIEGNTSRVSGVVKNGGEVAKKSYSISDNKIAGYGRPAYESIQNEELEITKMKMKVDDKIYDFSRILKDEENFVKLRDFEKAGYKVGYDVVSKMPSFDK